MRAAEDVTPEEHMDRDALGILLPALGPESRVHHEIIEDATTDVVSTRLEFLAEIMTANILAALLALGEKQSELHAIDVEIVIALFELHDARLCRTHALRVVERQLAWNREIDDVIDQVNLVCTTKHTANVN